MFDVIITEQESTTWPDEEEICAALFKTAAVDPKRRRIINLLVSSIKKHLQEKYSFQQGDAQKFMNMLAVLVGRNVTYREVFKKLAPVRDDSGRTRLIDVEGINPEATEEREKLEGLVADLLTTGFEFQKEAVAKTWKEHFYVVNDDDKEILEYFDNEDDASENAAETNPYEYVHGDVSSLEQTRKEHWEDDDLHGRFMRELDASGKTVSEFLGKMYFVLDDSSSIVRYYNSEEDASFSAFDLNPVFWTPGKEAANHDIDPTNEFTWKDPEMYEEFKNTPGMFYEPPGPGALYKRKKLSELNQEEAVTEKIFRLISSESPIVTLRNKIFYTRWYTKDGEELKGEVEYTIVKVFPSGDIVVDVKKTPAVFTTTVGNILPARVQYGAGQMETVDDVVRYVAKDFENDVAELNSIPEDPPEPYVSVPYKRKKLSVMKQDWYVSRKDWDRIYDEFFGKQRYHIAVDQAGVPLTFDKIPQINEYTEIINITDLTGKFEDLQDPHYKPSPAQIEEIKNVMKDAYVDLADKKGFKEQPGYTAAMRKKLSEVGKEAGVKEEALAAEVYARLDNPEATQRDYVIFYHKEYNKDGELLFSGVSYIISNIYDDGVSVEKRKAIGIRPQMWKFEFPEKYYFRVGPQGNLLGAAENIAEELRDDIKEVDEASQPPEPYTSVPYKRKKLSEMEGEEQTDWQPNAIEDASADVDPAADELNSYNPAGKKHGLWEETTRGNARTMGHYNNGVKTGPWKIFHSNGQTKFDGAYKNDLRDGKWTVFYDTGAKAQEGNFDNGHPKGLWITYYENGSKMREGVYDPKYVYQDEGFEGLPKKVGKWKEYFDNGQIGEVGEYNTQGDKVGEWLTYSELGPLERKEEFSKGKLNGQSTIYYSNGAVEIEKTYSNGRLTGKATFYHENGNKIDDGYYLNEKKDGLWVYYDNDGTGTVEHAVIYKDDKAVSEVTLPVEGPRYKRRKLSDIQKSSVAFDITRAGWITPAGKYIDSLEEEHAIQLFNMAKNSPEGFEEFRENIEEMLPGIINDDGTYNFNIWWNNSPSVIKEAVKAGWIRWFGGKSKRRNAKNYDTLYVEVDKDRLPDLQRMLQNNSSGVENLNVDYIENYQYKNWKGTLDRFLRSGVAVINQPNITQFRDMAKGGARKKLSEVVEENANISMSGVLKRPEKDSRDGGYLILDAPSGFMESVYKSLKDEQPDLERSPNSAHISVMTDEEVEQIGGFDKIEEYGESFKYEAHGIDSVDPEGWDDMEKVFFVRCKSPELEELRKKYGLPALPNEDHEFHITVGVLPKEQREKMGSLIVEEAIK